MPAFPRSSTGRMLLGTLVGLAALLATAAAHAESPLDPYLPKKGNIQGHVVTFAIAPADQDISARFRHSVQANMEWFKTAVRSNPPGKPLPYDAHMGITAAEYDRLEHMTPVVKQGEAVTIAVARDSNGTVHLKPVGTGAAVLDGVSFPPDGKTAVTPVGTLAIMNQLHQTDPAQPFGAFDGVEWAQVEPADTAKPSAKLGFGKRASDGGGLVYFQIAPYRDHEEQTLVVFYPLP